MRTALLPRATAARAAAGALLLVGIGALAPARAAGQGSVGTQGFGYPTGQLSTRARGSAGAVGPFDAESPLNPAALTGLGAATLHAQYDPEFRSVETASGSERTTFSRFPLVLAGLPIGRRGAFALSAATYLDRTFATSARGTQTVADTTIETRQTRRAVGGLTDVRVAYGYALSGRLSVGAAVHGYTGENRVRVSFADDSARFISFQDSVRLSYGGIAGSAGVTWRALRHLSLASAYKVGGSLRVRDDATNEQLGSGRVPDQLTAGLIYDGLSGTTIAASAGWQGWSAMNELGSASTRARDAREVALGADAAGPRFGRGVVALRAGAGWRELPFPVPGEGEATELAFGFGAGLPLAFNRATLDLGVQRARRSAGDASETAWMFSLGLSVRP